MTTPGSRELDALVFISACWPTYRLQTRCDEFPEQVRPGRIQEGNHMAWREAPGYTTSLDAAMTLVPEGRFVGALNQCDEGGEWYARIEAHDAVYEDATSASAALALTTACLRLALTKTKAGQP